MRTRNLALALSLGVVLAAGGGEGAWLASAAAAPAEGTTAAESLAVPRILVNGSRLTLAANPYIKRGRVMVPLRGMAEGIGAKVLWDAATRTATVKRGDHEARITAGSSAALKNGRQAELDAPAEVKRGVMYIPLRFSAESLGGRVTWSAKTASAAITLPLASDTARELIKEQADKAVAALKSGDWAAIAGMSTAQGIRFSPYGYVDRNDRVLSRDQLANAAQDKEAYVWGAYDGSGEAIKLTFAEYAEKFIYSSDFAAAPQIGYNKTIGMGNTLNNVHQVYPDAIVVEYHYDGFDPQYAGMDWESLRLVFQKEGSQWRLAGIIHDQWTI
ncbi:copper amine oxidase N-terminal domain-containing protein [Paenibacillus donghaensis]|uniref:Copper amine oxidase-like N-terminal domain-containing protein n=1 Tax=Paenibacillus donghaensis TaxID=414771 RepID=A0A2Z2KU12_9BACL|nr:copper amine oxidase N-terminal domain-containing protein [Paenibacillus donghaensis]ASA25492.1 hypothetical protein B9T62_35035 [Paenibacillus donghaensis]